MTRQRSVTGESSDLPSEYLIVPTEFSPPDSVRIGIIGEGRGRIGSAIPVAVSEGLFPPDNSEVGDAVTSAKWEILVIFLTGDMDIRNPVIVVTTDIIGSVECHHVFSVV